MYILNVLIWKWIVNKLIKLGDNERFLWIVVIIMKRFVIVDKKYCEIFYQLFM